MFLTIKNLSKSYKKNKVLNKLNLVIRKGEIISVVGSSGSGKSTLLKSISGLDSIDSGEIIINSKKIQNTPTNERNIGYVFQESPLLPHINIIKNILFNYKKYDHNKLSFLLEKMEIKNIVDRYPHEISGGENQRVAVARSLIREPDIFLLDEPFSNLDFVNKNHTKEIIFDIIKKTNTTTIIVNHDVQDSLEISDRILVLNKQKDYFIDTPYNIYTKPNNIETATLFGYVNKIEIEDNSFYFRPEKVNVVEKSDMIFKIIKVKYLGSTYKIVADYKGQKIIFFHNKKLEKKTKIYVDIKNKLTF